MADETIVSPDQLRTSATGVASAADVVRSQSDSHQQNMEGQSDAFGGDDLGSLIQGCYQAIHELAFGSYQDNTDALHGHAQKLHAMAANHDDAEQSNTANVNNVRGVLG
jgi:hypothetical protein